MSLCCIQFRSLINKKNVDLLYWLGPPQQLLTQSFTRRNAREDSVVRGKKRVRASARARVGLGVCKLPSQQMNKCVRIIEGTCLLGNCEKRTGPATPSREEGARTQGGVCMKIIPKQLRRRWTAPLGLVTASCTCA